jgi:hypothetical protein
MRTITFYSYKGGVGRSLLVANTARYLSILGKSVFAVDFDLEAPGLHYKFHLGSNEEAISPLPGVIDILSNFLQSGEFSDQLDPFTTSLPVAPEAGKIRVMRAGAAPSADYWRALSRINWHDLFYGTNPVGAPFFLELQERVRHEFNPDFLLIDARTGITDMGGVATTLLPDTVVCLGLAGAEHLDGLRAVMHGIYRTTKEQGDSVRLVPVVSRFLLQNESAQETQELARIRGFLSSPITSDATELPLDEVIALHAEPLLSFREQLLVGGTNSPHDLPLLRDYMRLFSKIIPAEDVRPHVGQLIQRAVSRLLDDPEGAQSDLEALTAYCADQEAYRALLKFYRVRKAPLEKSVATAALMWQLRSSNQEPDQLILDVIKLTYSEPRLTDLQKKYAEFAEDVCRSTGLEDAHICLTVANAYLPERRDRAVQLLLDYVETSEVPYYGAVVRLLDLARSDLGPNLTLKIINRFKDSVDATSFHAAWARFVVQQKDRSLALATLEDKAFRVQAVRTEDPVTFYKVVKLAGKQGASTLLRDAVEMAIVREDYPQLKAMAELFQQEGRFDEFEENVRTRVSEVLWAEIVEFGVGRRRFRGLGR